MAYDDLPTPALLLDADILERNITRMQDRMTKRGVSLRPHIKTHKCIEVGKLQRSAGAKGITVSTMFEAEAFADAGFDDITWAFPIPPVYVRAAIRLAERCTFRVVVDSMEALEELQKGMQDDHHPVHVWLKIDCGYHRAGVDPESLEAERIVRALNDQKHVTFDGILSHSGHAYFGRDRDEILSAARQERDVMAGFAERMREDGYDVPAVSIGSTPAMSVIDHLDGIDEVRPGNYAFYDYTMVLLGVCSVEECALTVLASVISHQPGASHCVIDAGALGLSKDAGPAHIEHNKSMGALYGDYASKRLLAHVSMGALSQEHGKVKAESPEYLRGRFLVGDRVRILEHHSCLTAAAHDRYTVVRGDDIVDTWNILRGRTL